MTDLKKFQEGVEHANASQLGALLEQTEEGLQAARGAHDAEDERVLQEELNIVLNALSLREFEAGVRALSREQRGALLEQQESITQAAREMYKGNPLAPELLKEEQRLHTVVEATRSRGQAA